MSHGSVVIWCDLGPDIGVGHLMRCIALAEEIDSRGLDLHFLVDATAVPFASAQLASRGFDWSPPPAAPADQLAWLDRRRPAAVVIDSYRLGPEVYAAVRAAHRTLALVDGDIAGRSADLYLDQNIGAEDDAWALPADGATGEATRLAGLRFALMRDDVLRHRPAAPDDGALHTPPRVLAFFGGTDAFGAAPVLAQALVATGLPLELTAIAASDDSRNRLAALPLAAGQRITVIGPTDHLAELVRDADLVVSAAGTSSWELLCLGAAAAFVCVADNQAQAYDRVAEQELAVALGQLDDVRADPAGASAALRSVLLDVTERTRLRRVGWELVDGRGRARVADALIGPLG